MRQINILWGKFMSSQNHTCDIFSRARQKLLKYLSSNLFHFAVWKFQELFMWKIQFDVCQQSSLKNAFKCLHSHFGSKKTIYFGKASSAIFYQRIRSQFQFCEIYVFIQKSAFIIFYGRHGKDEKLSQANISIYLKIIP